MKPWFLRSAGEPDAPFAYRRSPLDARLDAPGRVEEIEVRSLEERLQVIKRMVQLGVRDPRMHAVAAAVTRACPWRDDACEARAIFDWVTGTVCAFNPTTKKMVCQTRIRYGGEPPEMDTYRSPMRTLDIRIADCDDGTSLIATLGLLNGFFAKAVVTSNTGQTWDHIYPMFGLPKGSRDRWVALDFTLGPGRFGTHPPQAAKREFPL